VASHGEEAQTNTDVHSSEHVITGADGEELRTSDLVELFDDDHCEGLKDKPKFFFIQVFSFYLKYIYSIAILVYRISKNKIRLNHNYKRM
jgi:hypothetical protein